MWANGAKAQQHMFSVCVFFHNNNSYKNNRANSHFFFLQNINGEWIVWLLHRKTKAADSYIERGQFTRPKFINDNGKWVRKIYIGIYLYIALFEVLYLISKNVSKKRSHHNLFSIGPAISQSHAFKDLAFKENCHSGPPQIEKCSEKKKFMVTLFQEPDVSRLQTYYVWKIRFLPFLSVLSKNYHFPRSGQSFMGPQRVMAGPNKSKYCHINFFISPSCFC